MEIPITCKGQKYVKIDVLKNFQGNLKELRKAELAKLKSSIIKHGFSFPVFVWGDQILDGHQRIFATKKLLKEGYKIGKIPVVEIEAKDRAEAAEKLLFLNSAYAKITDDGLYEFLNDNALKIEDFASDLNLPAFDMDAFLQGFGPEVPTHEETDEQVDLKGVDTLDGLAPNKEEIQIFKDRKIIIEFSGGKDSSATAIWAKYFFPSSEIILHFCDMGADFVSLPLFLYRFASSLGVDLQVLRASKTMHEVLIELNKWPGFNHPACHKLLHDTLDDRLQAYCPDDVVVLRGGRASERGGQTKKNKDRFLTIDRLKQYTFFQPLYFSTKGLGEKIIEEQGLFAWDGYEYGLQRTACRICPGQRPIAYAAIRKNYPDVWKELKWFQDRFGPGCWNDPKDGLGRGELEYLADKGQADFEAGNYLTKC